MDFVSSPEVRPLMRFERHSHGKGPEHYACETDGFVFEIYPQQNETGATKNTRIGFKVESVDNTLQSLRDLDVEVVSPARDSEWGVARGGSRS